MRLIKTTDKTNVVIAVWYWKSRKPDELIEYHIAGNWIQKRLRANTLVKLHKMHCFRAKYYIVG